MWMHNCIDDWNQTIIIFGQFSIKDLFNLITKYIILDAESSNKSSQNDILKQIWYSICSFILSFYAIIAGWMIAHCLAAAANLAGASGAADCSEEA